MVSEPNRLADAILDQAYNRKIAEYLGYHVFVENLGGSVTFRMFKKDDRRTIAMPEYDRDLDVAMSLPFGDDVYSLSVTVLKDDGQTVATVCYKGDGSKPNPCMTVKRPGHPAFAVCELWHSAN